MHTITFGVNCVIGRISQDKQAINTSKYITKITIKIEFTKNSLKSQKQINLTNYYYFHYEYTHNGSFFLC